MKHRAPPFPYYDPRDFAPRETKRSGLFDVLGNAIGVLCLFGGIVLFIVVGHFA